MRYRIPGALFLVLVLLGAGAAPVSADIVDLSNGLRLPKKSEIESPWGEFPADHELRASGKNNLSMGYDAFEIGNRRGDAAQLVNVYVTAALLENQDFAAGEQHGARGYWAEAAEAFGRASEELEGAGQQVALYKRMLAAANIPDANLTLRAADELLAGNPKSFYFGPAQEMRARIFARAGRTADAVAALKQVTDAPGMNVRDYFSAAHTRLWLTEFVPAKDAAAFEDAETKLRALLTELDRHPRHELAIVPKLKTMMLIADCVRALGRAEEAKQLLNQILASTDDNTDRSVLAGVYYGLGDVAFEEASEQQKLAKGNPLLKEKVREMLEASALHYLRVVLLYKDFAGQREMFGATQGVARVFSTLFTLSGEKDCDLARRAYDYYVQAVNLQPQGEQRRLLVREGKALKQRIDQACEAGEAETTREPAEGEDEGE